VHACASNHHYNVGAKELADLVSAKMGGRPKITVCPSGQSGGERDTAEALQARTTGIHQAQKPWLRQ